MENGDLPKKNGDTMGMEAMELYGIPRRDVFCALALR